MTFIYDLEPKMFKWLNLTFNMTLNMTFSNDRDLDFYDHDFPNDLGIHFINYLEIERL